MARFCTLCSSSSGNSTYIGCNSGGVLVDAGTNAKRIIAALEHINVVPESINAIFITHEHNDHVGALRVFASKYKWCPITWDKDDTTFSLKYNLAFDKILKGKDHLWQSCKNGR